jgi:hypothetical protein
MPGPRSPLIDHLPLTDAERHDLTHRCRCTTIAAGQRDRAAIILLLADGQSVSATARRVGVARRIARKWGERFVTDRLAGLTDQPRAGRPPGFPPSGDGPPRPARLRAAGPPRTLALPVGLPGTGAAIGGGRRGDRDLGRDSAPSPGRPPPQTMALPLLADPHPTPRRRLCHNRRGVVCSLHPFPGPHRGRAVGGREDVDPAATTGASDPPPPRQDPGGGRARGPAATAPSTSSPPLTPAPAG